jgi:hypothetical protein
MTWPVAFSIVGIAVSICVAAVKIFPCKMSHICKDLFIRTDERVDNAMKSAWREVDASKEDRAGIRENIRAVEKTAIELETEVAGIHSEIKDIKTDVRTILERINTLSIAVAKRNGDSTFRHHEENT